MYGKLHLIVCGRFIKWNIIECVFCVAKV